MKCPLSLLIAQGAPMSQGVGGHSFVSQVHENFAGLFLGCVALGSVWQASASQTFTLASWCISFQGTDQGQELSGELRASRSPVGFILCSAKARWCGDAREPGERAPGVSVTLQATAGSALVAHSR